MHKISCFLKKVNKKGKHYRNSQQPSTNPSFTKGLAFLYFVSNGIFTKDSHLD